MNRKYDVIIVGTGVAGLNCALHLDENKKILVICKSTVEKSDSFLAQGGICCLRGQDDFDSYFEDTMKAGHNENNLEAVTTMIESSPKLIGELMGYGVEFAKNADGTLAVTREGGHSKNRICFHEDCTGKEITSKLLECVRQKKNVEIMTETTMLDVIIEDGECLGIVALNNFTGGISRIFADYTVLACGGIGGVFNKTTNFRVLTGDGVAICLKHGIAVDNINYIQIHPTTLYSEKGGRCFLISESVRGEGAVLLDKHFNRFTDELQPRDVVTAEILKQMEKDSMPHVWLDMRGIDKKEIVEHFPTIVSKCREEGIDVFNECIPVVPAQHYFMGGIRSDVFGKTTMPRLYAVGETCCNGVHGANRLASNSLLESLIFAERAAENINSNYENVDRQQFLKAEFTPLKREYSDPHKLLESYKMTIKLAIKEAENVKHHNINFE